MKILFVCTGNIFRSMSAEYCAKKYAKDHNLDIEIASAGTGANPQNPHPVTVKTLAQMGINCNNHKQQKLNKKIISSADVIVAMGTDHQKFIKEHFGMDVPLFNELAYGKSEGVLDIWESVNDFKNKPEEVDKHVISTVTYIHTAIPKLMKQVQTIST